MEEPDPYVKLYSCLQYVLRYVIIGDLTRGGLLLCAATWFAEFIQDIYYRSQCEMWIHNYPTALAWLLCFQKGCAAFQHHSRLNRAPANRYVVLFVCLSSKQRHLAVLLYHKHKCKPEVRKEGGFGTGNFCFFFNFPILSINPFSRHWAGSRQGCLNVPEMWQANIS